MNVSSVKNLNGETFSAVQDTALTNIVSSNSANWNEISAYQANSGNYLTAVPVGTMNESAFSYDANDKISGYNGSAFAGGGGGTDLDFGYDENGAISSINTSALSDSRAGTPLYVESPLFTGQSGDSAYIGSDINETVLWSGERYLSATGALELSENPYNFEKIELWGRAHETHKATLGTTIMPNIDDKTYADVCFIGVQDNLDFVRFNCNRFDMNTTGFNIANQKQFSFNQSGPVTANNATVLMRVIGFNRIR